MDVWHGILIGVLLAREAPRLVRWLMDQRTLPPGGGPAPSLPPSA